MTSFLILMTWGGVTYPWSSWRTLVPLLAGVAGLIFFMVWEGHFAAEPMIPLRLFKNRSAAAAYFGTFVNGLVLWCLLYYMPLYFEVVKGQTPVLSGVALFPMTITVAPAAIVVGIAAVVTGTYRWSIWLGWTLTVLGLGLSYLLDIGTSKTVWISITLVTGLGTGVLFTGNSLGVQAPASERDAGSAVALSVFLRTFGQACGVAMGGVVFQNEIRRRTASYAIVATHAADYAANSSALVEVIRAMDLV